VTAPARSAGPSGLILGTFRPECRAHRQSAHRAGATVWITGLPAAGKTTLASALARELSDAGHSIRLLDGDDLRRDACRDLGFDRAGRAEMASRVARLAVSLASGGTMVIVALVSPYAADRRAARELHAESRIPFLEIFLDTPVDVCRGRDPKGLYARASRGHLSGLTGVDDPYERPDNPDLRLPVQTVGRSLRAVLDALTASGVRLGPLHPDAAMAMGATANLAPTSGAEQ
jgi:adenylyl-sulfate kinase